MQQTQEDVAEWVSIREAARACSVAIRTIYAQVERNELDTRKVGRMLHVKLSEVRRLAERQTGNVAGRGPADMPALAAARERVTAMHLAVQEAQSGVLLERHRQELAAAEEERDRKRALLELQAERERLALFRDRAALEREQAERGEQIRRAEHERALARAARERELTAERAAARRATWEAVWVAWASAWLDQHLGIEGDKRKLTSVVRKSLELAEPCHPDDVVGYCLERTLHQEFDPEITARTRRDAEEKRERTAREVARAVAGDTDAVPLLMPWARLGLTIVDPTTMVGKVALVLLVREAYDRIRTDTHFATAMGEYVATST
jgi:hypothetical protein